MRKLINIVNEMALAAAVSVTTSVGSRLMDRADNMAASGKYRRNALFAGIIAGSFSWDALALAGTTCGAKAGATATSNITNFIGDLADFAIGLGGAGALLMFALGAILVIFGGNPSRVRRGMDVIKHAVIGLVVLGAGAFIKFIVLDVVLGAASQGGATNGNAPTGCLNQGAGSIPVG